MTRPTTVDDLTDYKKKPHEFLSLEITYLTRDVKVGAAALALIQAVRESEAFVLSEDGEFKVTVPLTEAELESRVKSEQRSWDYTRDDYEHAVNGTKTIETWRRYAIDEWAKREDRDPINWEKSN